MSAGSSLSRLLIIHLPSKACLYDLVTPGDEPVWMLSDEKTDFEERQLKFPVSGTKRDRDRRQELVALVELFFQISRTLGQEGVCKACFQEPAANRGNNFAVKFQPHFGSLARPKRNVAAETKSMIFGHATIEMIVATHKRKKNYDLQTTNHSSSDSHSAPIGSLSSAGSAASTVPLKQGNHNHNQMSAAATIHKSTTIIHKPVDKLEQMKQGVIVAIFYGPSCKEELVKDMAYELLDLFCETFAHELKNLDNFTVVSEDDPPMRPEDFVIHRQERVMSPFQKFDEISLRLLSNVDRKERRPSFGDDYDDDESQTATGSRGSDYSRGSRDSDSY